VRALILVDIQNDFCPGGALEVPRGDEVVAVANRVQQRFELVVATQDWHPRGHGSFASSHPGRRPGEVIDLHQLPQVLWPDHCVQGSRGAEFHPELATERVAAVFRKGMDPAIDSYSGFFDNGHRKATGLAGCLRELGAKQVHVLGLAADYCVKFTALDARREGFETFLVVDGTRGVDLRAGDVDQAISEMREAGVEIVESARV
jgi:nicotinamidase/pyrazinamidase